MNKKSFKNTFLIVFLSFFGLIGIYYLRNVSISNNDYSKSSTNWNQQEIKSCSQKYVNTCLKLYAKLSSSFAREINRAPPKRIPDELFDEFTQHGSMPVRDYLYINEAVPWNENEQIKEIMMKSVENKWEKNDESKIRDELRKRSITSETESKNKQVEETEIISKRVLDEWRIRVRNKQPLNYGNTQLQKLMFDHASQFRNKTIVIYGNQFVWIEAILLELGVGKITVLDNKKIQYDQSDLLERISFRDFVEKSLKKSEMEQFDHAISFSFIQHLGLGRFGDVLNPNADLEGVII